MISVVMPTFNKPLQLELSLKSLAEQDIPKEEYEVVVVDDDSEEDLAPIIQSYCQIMQLQYKKIDKSGRAGARNIAIDMAKGKIIIFSDDDAVMAPEFIRLHREIHKKNQNAIVLGKRRRLYLRNDTIINELANWKGSLNLIRRNVARDDSYEVLTRKIFVNPNHSCPYTIPWMCSITANMSVEKKVLKEVGKFDVNFKGWGVEDIELGYRLYNKGLDYLYYDTIVNYHVEHHRDTTKMKKEMITNLQKFYIKSKEESLKEYWKFLIGKQTLKTLILSTQSEGKCEVPGIEQIPDETIHFFYGSREDIFS